MKNAAALLTLALGDDLDNGILPQKTLVALMSDGRIEDAVKLAERMQGCRHQIDAVSLTLMQEQAREGHMIDALTVAARLCRTTGSTRSRCRWCAPGSRWRRGQGGSVRRAGAAAGNRRRRDAAQCMALLNDGLRGRRQDEAATEYALTPSMPASTIPRSSPNHVTTDLREGDDKCRAHHDRPLSAPRRRAAARTSRRRWSIGSARPSRRAAGRRVKRGLAIAIPLSPWS